MITLLVEENNPLSQSSYDFYINNLQFHQLTCSCGHSGCLSIHGYYNRKIKTREGSFLLTVCRVICTVCGRTHAILPSSIVPYSQLTLKCCCQIILDLHGTGDVNAVCDDYPDVDENNVKSVIRRYRRFWKARLISEHINLYSEKSLILFCFSFFAMQFMQIRRTINILQLKTT